MKPIKTYLIAYALLLGVMVWAILVFPKPSLHLWLCGAEGGLIAHVPFLDMFMRYYTKLAEWPLYVLMLLPLCWREGRYTACFLVAELLQVLLTQPLKFALNMPRPVRYFEEMFGTTDMLPLVDGVRMASWHSFPSGHTATFFAFATVVVCLLASRAGSSGKTGRAVRSGTALLLLLFAALGGYSRIYLSQHFLMDVCFGSLIGVLAACVACWLVGRYVSFRASKISGKKALMLLLLLSMGVRPAQAQLRADNVDSVLAVMTLEEKAQLVVGNGWGSMFSGFGLSSARGHRLPGAAGETRAIPRLGIPSLVLSDGPSGVRHKEYSIAFPSPLLLASSADTALVYRVARLMGEEALQKGVDVLLGPGMNLQRSPLCGRGFEYFSEDPDLTADMAIAMVRGLQDAGVGACIKHFALNNQETDRMHVSAEVDSAVLQQVWLAPWRRVVQEAQPLCVMSAYNGINGVPCRENSWLLTDQLRHSWGYKGLVMTDWWFRRHPVAQLAAGNDLLTPGSRLQVADIKRAVKKGTLSEERLNEAARRVLCLVAQRLPYKEQPRRVCTKNILLRQATAQSMVLLENREHTLPLVSEGLKVSLFGCCSYELILTGTGSGFVRVAGAANLADGLEESGCLLMAEPTCFYADYMRKQQHRLHQGGFGPISRYTGKSAFREPLLSDSVIRTQARMSDVCILTIGRQAGEALDRSLRADWLLTEAERSNLERLSEAFHQQGKRLIVVLNIAGPIETASWKHLADAIVLCWLPGQEGGVALADVLTGKVAPQGKLPVTFAADYFEHPASASFPLSQRADKALIPDSVNYVGNQRLLPYTEGAEVGHFYYDRTGIAPSYPFGYGLTY